MVCSGNDAPNPQAHTGEQNEAPQRFLFGRRNRLRFGVVDVPRYSSHFFNRKGRPMNDFEKMKTMLTEARVPFRESVDDGLAQLIVGEGDDVEKTLDVGYFKLQLFTVFLFDKENMLATVTALQ